MPRPQFSLSAVLLATTLAAVCAALWAADPSWQAGLLQLPVLIAMPALIAILASRSVGCTRAFFAAILVIMAFAAMIQCEVLYNLANFSFPPTYSVVQGFGVGPPPREIYHWHEAQRVLASLSGQIHGTLVLWFIAVLAGAISAAMHRLVAWALPRG